MESSITCGQFNNNYKYIIFLLGCLILKDHVFGWNYNDSFLDLKIFTGGKQDSFSSHIYIHQFFCYLGTSILGIIFYYFEKQYSENEENPKFPPLDCIFIIILWIIEEQAIENYYTKIFKDLDFWMIEIIILSILNYKVFKVNLYNFQKIVIFLNLFPIFFKILTIILSFVDVNNRNSESEEVDFHYKNGNLKIIYVVYWVLVPLCIPIYLALITSRSYVNLKIKSFMDEKYISENYLLMVYGTIGAIISFLICFISTFVKCAKEVEIIDGKNDIYDYFCKVKESINNNDSYVNKYLDNFPIYFKNFNSNASDIMIELFIIIFGIISFFFNKYFSLKIIKYLSPTHVIFSFPIYYFLHKPLSIIKTLIFKESFFIKNHINYITEKLSFDIIGDILAFIGFLIYLEIIELRFGGLDYYLRINIITRHQSEVVESSNKLKEIKKEKKGNKLNNNQKDKQKNKDEKNLELQNDKDNDNISLLENV